jgi:predicted esterase
MQHASGNPHHGRPVSWKGRQPAEARLAVILVHGRGSSAENILALADQFDVRDVAYAAPQADGSSWYPYSFLSPISQNEPALSSGLERLARLVGELEHEGLSADRVALVGFSQGACLALEFAARHARRYAGIAGLSGGLIGPPGTPRAYDGSLDGTPVFLGCSDVDAHIPVERVHESAAVFRRLGAVVDERIYAGMGHTVNEDEIETVRILLTTGSPRPGTVE